MKRYFIETSTIVNYLRSKADAVELINSLEGEFTSSYSCLAELYEGIFRVRNKRKAERDVLQFFIGLSQVYSLDQETAKEFGNLRASLKRKGKVIEDMDLLVAAICLAKDLILVTYNSKHFQRIRNLEVLALPN